MCLLGKNWSNEIFTANGYLWKKCETEIFKQNSGEISAPVELINDAERMNFGFFQFIFVLPIGFYSIGL